MALSPIEDRYLSALTEREFPTFTPEQAAMASPDGVDSVQLAAGPSATVSDAGSGMPEMRATPRNPVMGGVADFVRGVRDLANQYEIKDFVPLLGGMGVGDLLVGKSPEELEEWAYGNSPITMPPSGTGGYVPVVKTGRKEQLMDTMFLGVDAAGLGKGAAMTGKAAAKNLGPKAAEMAGDMLKRQGLMPGVMPDGQTMPANPQAAVSDLGFFSAVEQAALNVQRKSGTGQAFLNDIAKGENVKADEIKWIGLDDFLKGKKNVTRDEVQQFIAQNKVEIQEVTLDDATAVMKERQELEAMSNDELADAAQMYDTSSPTFREDAINSIVENRNSYFDGYPEDDFRGGTKFGQYALPGGENYREILLTMPDNTDPQKARLAFEQRMQQKYGSFNTMKFTDAEKAESESTMQAILNNDGVVSKGQVFKSSHWEQPNVLAHIRVNDRVDADGKKMLLIEEVQSDWHQAGRDKGYKGKGPTELPSNFEIVENIYSNNPNTKFNVVNKETGLHSGWSGATPEEARDTWLAAQARKMDKTDAVPDAPMKDTWYQLALKRALKYAADNGYERVGITTGARQAERYDLSKQVDGIFYTKNDDGTFNVSVAKGDSEVWADTAAKPERLSEVVGKDIAKKIVDGEGSSEDGAKALRGLDLQVGGEGMKKYYDEVYPKFLEKYGKKWGAKVGETTIETQKPTIERSGTAAWKVPGKTEPVRYVDITPEMRQSVSKGQPLFTAAPIGAGTAATMQDEENQ